jgi:hypothetical protein
MILFLTEISADCLVFALFVFEQLGKALFADQQLQTRLCAVHADESVCDKLTTMEHGRYGLRKQVLSHGYPTVAETLLDCK